MTLKDRITEDMKTAMRAKDSARLLTVRMLLAAIKQREVDERIELDDGQTIAIVDKQIKQRKDSIAAFTQAGRQDLVDKESAELTVLTAYLPERLDAAALSAAVDALVVALSAELGRAPQSADMGKLMALAKSSLASKADMASVSAAVKAALSKTAP